MSIRSHTRTTLKVLITVKTYPIPSTKYDELVCTAGVTEDGKFIRLYPINFRDLSDEQQYQKYQWIEVEAQKHESTDIRKESYRPNTKTLRVIGDAIPTKSGNWDERKQYVLKQEAQSLDELKRQSKEDQTSLGIFKPRIIKDLEVSDDEKEWDSKFLAELEQSRLWEDRTVSLRPPRKVPHKFHYTFDCNDDLCNGHRLGIHDWELGRLYWKMIDEGKTDTEAVQLVRRKFFDEICSDRNDTYFFVGTMKDSYSAWIVLGAFYPKKQDTRDLFGFTQ